MPYLAWFQRVSNPCGSYALFVGEKLNPCLVRPIMYTSHKYSPESFRAKGDTKMNSIYVATENRIAEIKRAFNEDRGAAMAEYGLLIALIAVVCIATIGYIGTNLNAKFNEVNTKLTS